MPPRTYRSEGPANYGKYQFGYCEWMELADGDCLEDAYSNGFLPFSADLHQRVNAFYMARSLRVSLRSFRLDKKRRYDHREWQAYGLQRAHFTKEEFMDKFGKSALSKAEEWMQKRFGDAYLSQERLQYILSKPFLEEVMAWTLEGTLQAFALIVRGSWGAHYWYVFYATDQATDNPPGHGYLVDFLEWARFQDLPYAYLGTAYGKKSRYKSRGIQGVEFWNGNDWEADKDRLGSLQELD